MRTSRNVTGKNAKKRSPWPGVFAKCKRGLKMTKRRRAKLKDAVANYKQQTMRF